MPHHRRSLPGQNLLQKLLCLKCLKKSTAKPITDYFSSHFLVENLKTLVISTIILYILECLIVYRVMLKGIREDIFGFVMYRVSVCVRCFERFCTIMIPIRFFLLRIYRPENYGNEPIELYEREYYRTYLPLRILLRIRSPF